MTEPRTAGTDLSAPTPAAAVGNLLKMLRGPRKLVCGILNVTPDSFSDGGAYWNSGAAVRHGLRLIEEGADILDIGGESTRPGARPPSTAAELDRVVRVIEQLARWTDTPLSIDTSRPEVMREAVAAGATMINDVRALRYPGAVEMAAGSGVPVCLSHMLRPPHLMQRNPSYVDVLAEVREFLWERIEVCAGAGMPREQFVIDPGFGFGKNREHNLTLLRSLSAFTELGAPVMAGLSRKAVLGEITGRPVQEREAASVTAAVLAAQRGAKILRVHDVAATVDALKVLAAIED
ncbi:dihydropteroate synthase [Saccharopolyspora spinosa]|uniref:Dihydropteroate synthase n=1 Tax=Saccharopolyspora spinosa TaxID=60894 RepID=A0A2N3Y2E5_SACSN|nr:dihydropteroate synthase [Saccharopolyspora spinosa]PKW17103.1 dihydropteroate synthase [Saccharopolyspora spinosa]